MHRFQKLTLASLLLLGGIASSLAAPRIDQDQYGVSYMQNLAGTWYAHGLLMHGTGLKAPRLLSRRTDPCRRGLTAVNSTTPPKAMSSTNEA